MCNCLYAQSFPQPSITVEDKMLKAIIREWNKRNQFLMNVERSVVTTDEVVGFEPYTCTEENNFECLKV